MNSFGLVKIAYGARSLIKANILTMTLCTKGVISTAINLFPFLAFYFTRQAKSNGLNQMNFYVYELQLKNQAVKSCKIQMLMQSLADVKHESYIRILDFLVAFKQNDHEVTC